MDEMSGRPPASSAAGPLQQQPGVEDAHTREAAAPHTRPMAPAPELVVCTPALRRSLLITGGRLDEPQAAHDAVDEESDARGQAGPVSIDAASLETQIAALVGGAPPVMLARRYRSAVDDEAKRRAPCKRWRWQPFTNPARSDALVLHHWACDPDATVSRFAAMGAQPSIFTYTDDEYETHLKDTMWTKEETDHLFSLCCEFELRFFVIADRYEMPTPRSIEDLKHRYYSVSRALIQARFAQQDPQRKSLSSKFAYDKGREVERKRQLVRLMQRSREQIEEEMLLMHELKRRELREERWTKEREAILRSLMSHELPGQPAPLASQQQQHHHQQHPHQQYPNAVGGDSGVLGGAAVGAPSSVTSSQSRRKKRPSVKADDAHISTASANASAGGPSLDSPIVTIPISMDTSRGHQRDGDDSSQYGQYSSSTSSRQVTTRKERVPPGSHIRTARLQSFKTIIYNKMSGILSEHGIGMLPRMPTSSVCVKYDELRNAVANFIEARRQLDRLEHDIKVTQARKKATKEDLAAGWKPSVGPSSSTVSGFGYTGSSASMPKRPFASPGSVRETKRSRN